MRSLRENLGQRSGIVWLVLKVSVWPGWKEGDEAVGCCCQSGGSVEMVKSGQLWTYFGGGAIKIYR